MKYFRFILALIICSGVTSSLYPDIDEMLAEMQKNWELWRKHPELHPNVVKGTECRQAIKDGKASLEDRAVAKYLDLCKDPRTGLDNYRRAFVAAQYNLTIEECHKYNNMLLQFHRGCIDNSFSEEVAILVKVENILDPHYDIVELAIVINYLIASRHNYDDSISYEIIHKMRRDLERLMNIKIIYY